jgi:hypothetical protein
MNQFRKLADGKWGVLSDEVNELAEGVELQVTRLDGSVDRVRLGAWVSSTELGEHLYRIIRPAGPAPGYERAGGPKEGNVRNGIGLVGHNEINPPPHEFVLASADHGYRGRLEDPELWGFKKPPPLPAVPD